MTKSHRRTKNETVRTAIVSDAAADAGVSGVARDWFYAVNRVGNANQFPYYFGILSANRRGELGVYV